MEAQTHEALYFFFFGMQDQLARSPRRAAKPVDCLRAARGSALLVHELSSKARIVRA